jgi:uncharacterized protein
MNTHIDSHTLHNRLHATPQSIEAFCQRWHIVEFALFGSILREDFDLAQSDVDVLATFDPAFYRGVTEAMQMQDELEALCGRKVDLISRSALERSNNWITKQEILNSLQVLYVRQP